MKLKARKGPNSNLWKGGSDRTERKKIADWCNSIRSLKLIDYNYSCSMCGSSQRLELDHIKPVYSNPELSYEYDNIQVLCNSCHNEKHKIAGDKKQWSEKRAKNKMTVRWSKIKSVKYLGEEMTYDLEIDHESHNYVADGVIVHNSQRYSSATSVQDIELRKQAEKNRQSSAEAYNPEWVGGVKLSDIVSGHFQASLNLYNEMIQAGIAREVARDVLPLATETKIFMKGNIRSWIHYLEIRTADDTQKEHREIANGIRDIFKQNFPSISEALGWGM
jgi:thymidylate synthase (FAD)